ncbi:hypothetical protein AB0J01_28285 [Streptomyces sp. NPDC050204]|uniref:hypothetical protein n=1 Tax=Streptomyces sp. NPDC050204 TaxID=3155514 RepID=UPI00341B804E
MLWDAEQIYLHRANGMVEPYDWPEDHHVDVEWQAKSERYEDLLRDYSRAHPPAGGAHLIVDLESGVFDVSGKWSA